MKILSTVDLKSSKHSNPKERQCQRMLKVKVKVKSAESCPTICDPMDCSLPGSSLHGILQARVLEWVAVSFSNYHTITLISHASKVMLKILQARLQQYMKHELPDVQAGFRKGRKTRDQITNIHWIIKKSKRVLEKNLLLLH